MTGIQFQVQSSLPQNSPLHFPLLYNILFHTKASTMNKLKKLADTLLNLKPVIIAAIITAVTSVVLAIFSTGSVTQGLETNELPPAAIKRLPDEDTINRLRSELSRSVSATALHDLSDTYFSKNAGPAAIKDSIRMLINYANAHLADREHYTYRMYRLKKIMLNNPRRNINARIDGTDPEAFMLIQQLLQGIEYYKGPHRWRQADDLIFPVPVNLPRRKSL
jgi:hypothetical protein